MAVRAARVPITHDEALTFTHYLSQPLGATLRFAGPWPTNDHLLNSLLARLSFRLFGASPFALRLPNLLAHACFLLFSWLLVRRHAPAVALGGFVLLNANPLVLELFGLCRGYGLSLGFLVPGLYFVLRSAESPEPSARDEVLAVACLGAGALAQIVLVDVLAAAAAFLLARRALARRLRGAAPLFASCAATALLLAPPLLVFQRAKLLNIGGKSGFWTDSVANLVELSLHGASYQYRLLPLLTGALAAALLLAHAVALATRRARLVTALAVADLTAFATVLQHHLLGTDYLTDRTAISFVPLLGLVIVEAAAALDGGALRIPAAGALSAAAFVSALHLVHVGDLDRSYLWWFDADGERTVADLARLPRPAGRPLRLGTVVPCEPSLNFYRVTRGLAWLAPVTREAPWGPFDDAYLLEDQADEARRRGFVPVARYARTRATLYRSPALGDGRPAEAMRLVPVVVEVPSRYATGLTIANAGTTEAAAALDYVPAVGSGLGTVVARIPAGGTLEIEGAIEWLRAHGLPIPREGSQVGTLLVVANGLSSPDALRVEARTAGMVYAALDPARDGATDRVTVPDLREDERARSNLAVVNLGFTPVVLDVTLRSGGREASVSEPETLAPFGWRQFDRPLAGAHLRSAEALVRRVGGSGRFAAYGVVIENATNEGRWLAGR